MPDSYDFFWLFIHPWENLFLSWRMKRGELRQALVREPAVQRRRIVEKAMLAEKSDELSWKQRMRFLYTSSLELDYGRRRKWQNLLALTATFPVCWLSEWTPTYICLLLMDSGLPPCYFIMPSMWKVQRVGSPSCLRMRPVEHSGALQPQFGAQSW